jgi:hypothetical protein
MDFKWFRFSAIFTPFTQIYVRKIMSKSSYIGVARYYVFGILVAEIQKTIPWDG